MYSIGAMPKNPAEIDNVLLASTKDVQRTTVSNPLQRASERAHGTKPSREPSEVYRGLVREWRRELGQEPEYLTIIKQTHKHYSKAKTKAALSALVELGHALEPYHDDIVLIGGLPTYLLTKGFFDHCGSNDIDLVVKSSIPRRGEKTIREILTSLNYNPSFVKAHVVPRKSGEVFGGPKDPHTFLKTDDKAYPVEVNFICDKSDNDEPRSYVNHFARGWMDVPEIGVPVQEGLNARPFPLTGIAFIFNSGERATVQNRTLPRIHSTSFALPPLPRNPLLRVIGLPGLLVLKSLRRVQPKDCYDIFALTHCNGGPRQAAELFNRSFPENVPERYLELFNIASQVISREFETGSSNGTHLVETFDGKQKSDVVAKQVTQFIEFCEQHAKARG